MEQPIIISIVNHKGGVLKTTVTSNLGAGLVRAGKKVLLIDVDSQQNLTNSLIGPVTDEKLTLADALLDENSLDDLIQSTNTPNLDIIPATEEFAAVELSLVSVVGREQVLSSCLEKTTRLSEYDFVIIDNPPAISLVVMNSILASDYFLIPFSAEYLPMVGVKMLLESIVKLRKLGPIPTLLGVLITLYARNENVCRHVEKTVIEQFGDFVFDTRIRVNTKAKSAPSVRKTIFEYENTPSGRGTQDYSKLSEEVLTRILHYSENQETTTETKVANA